ncbi:MAG: hypothetical protein AB1390_11775 [Nitrospirota bacterium]
MNNSVFRKEKKILFALSVAMLLIVLLAGCRSLLPSARQTVKSPWKTFDESRAAYDRIVINSTTADELKGLGFDPYFTPNIRILTYQDVIQRFMFNPTIEKEDLDEGVQRCIDAKTHCYAYEVRPGVITSKRLGNLWLDLLNFKRNTKESGWRFEALIVLVNDVVVYKLSGGNPVIDELRETKNPLGPLQSSEDLLIDITRTSIR